MAKVSVGLRGWRFEESEIFSDDGEFRPLEEIPEDDRRRLVRLPILMDRPCDACYLVHGEEGKRRCREAAVVYGEPLGEIVLCDRHEADFVYWYREAGGREYRGTDEFADAFHEWFDGGGRAPEGYGGVEHVDTDPDGLPDPPTAQELQERLEENFEGERIDLREYRTGDADAGSETGAAEGDDGDDGTAEDGEGSDDADGEGSDDADGEGSDDVDTGDESEETVPGEMEDIDLGRDYPTR
jgi:hypothetical protein